MTRTLASSAHAPIHLAGFMLAGPVVHSHAVWRHPSTVGSFLEADYYARAARELERGLFDFMFFADRLAVSENLGGSRDISFRYGAQDAARLDPMPLLSYVAAHTSRLGLGATQSTTYFQPNHVARAFATLDHLSKGRAAWNIVTSMNDSEGRIFGLDGHLEHDDRYDRADDFVEATFKLWQSWQADALILDRERGLFADPQKIQAVHHSGPWFKVDGPLNIPRPPQGRPVIIQAGSSARGLRFGARWAEVIFVIQPTPAQSAKFRATLRAEAERQGRNPNGIRILPAVMPFVGATLKEAEAKRDEHNALVRLELGVATMSGQLNFDFSAYPLDTPLRELAGRSELPAIIREKLQSFSIDGNPTINDVARQWAASVRVPQLVGTGEQIADQLIDWMDQGAGDGFVISPAFLPGSFTEFIDHVIPVLQARGRYRRKYEASTLRGHLGLDIPSATFGQS